MAPGGIPMGTDTPPHPEGRSKVLEGKALEMEDVILKDAAPLSYLLSHQCTQSWLNVSNVWHLRLSDISRSRAATDGW